MSMTRWLNLPCEGAILRSCTFGGNGKDGELWIETVGHPKVVVPTDQILIRELDGVEVTLQSIDDFEVELCVRPRAGVDVILREARIDVWNQQANMDHLFADWSEEPQWEMCLVCPIELSIGPVAPTVSTTSGNARHEPVQSNHFGWPTRHVEAL